MCPDVPPVPRGWCPNVPSAAAAEEPPPGWRPEAPCLERRRRKGDPELAAEAELEPRSHEDTKRLSHGRAVRFNPRLMLIGGSGGTPGGRSRASRLRGFVVQPFFPSASGFSPSSSGTTNRPSLRTRTSSKWISPPP